MLSWSEFCGVEDEARGMAIPESPAVRYNCRIQSAMAAITAILVAAFWCVGAVLIAWSRGYTPWGIVLCLSGIIVGGAGAGYVGNYALTSWTVISSTENVKIMACVAVLVGVLCGLYVAERLRDHEFPTTRQLMTATFGFIMGGMAGYVLLFFTSNTWAQGMTMFALIPATIGTATLAGSAMSHRFTD
jgi:hypothetical protein